MKHMKTLPLTLVLALCLGACGGDDADTSGKGNATSQAAPTKAELVKTLRNALAHIQAEKFDEAAALFVVPEDATDEEIAKQLGRMVERNEISEGGIAKLEQAGTFGPLAEVFPERGAMWAKRSKVEADACYALKLDGAEVAAHWDGGGFRLIRLDDVGKLK